MLSVIMPVLNGAATIATQLEALSQQQPAERWELIIADNGSADATVQIAEAWTGRIPSLQVVDASARRNIGAARNMGVAVARGELLLFCDADDVVGRGWAHAFAADQANWGLAGGPLDYTALSRPGVAPPGRVSPRAGELRWLPFGAGANLGAHRSVFDAIGGFRDDLLHGEEDIDFCWRAQLAGFRFGVVPGAVVAKRARSDVRALYRQHVAWGRASVSLYCRYREHGMPRPSVRQALRTYAWIGLGTRRLRDLEARREWARLAGVRWGRLLGSAKARTICL